MRQFLEPLSLEISPDSLSQGEQAIRQAIALQLYAQNIFTLGQSRRLADISVWEFQQLLAQHKIQRHYNETDLEQDIQGIQIGFEFKAYTAQETVSGVA
jgi:predicted HTH domain antitoxin